MRVAIKQSSAMICILTSLPDKVPSIELAEKLVSPEYHDFLPLFFIKEASVLLPYYYMDNKISLHPGAKLSLRRMYSMSNSELKEVWEWWDENSVKALIRPSSSSSAYLFIFVKKKDGSLCLYIDYKVFNNITHKDRYPLSQIGETLNQISRSKYFTWLDLRATFNLIQIKEGDK